MSLIDVATVGRTIGVGDGGEAVASGVVIIVACRLFRCIVVGFVVDVYYYGGP